MPKRIENLSRRPVLFTLTGGEPLRLSPGAVSASVADVEVADNRKIAGLVASGVIAIHDLDERVAPSQPTDGQPSEEPAAEGASGRRSGRRGQGP
jgi:hypothetical protein